MVAKPHKKGTTSASDLEEPAHYRRLVPRLLSAEAPLVWLSGLPGSGRRMLLAAARRRLGGEGASLAPRLALDQRALRTSLAALRAQGARRFFADDWPAEGLAAALGWLHPGEAVVASSVVHGDELPAEARLRATTIGAAELLLTPTEVKELLAARAVDDSTAAAWLRFSDGWLLPLELGIGAVASGAGAVPADDEAARRLARHEPLHAFLRERALGGLGADAIAALGRLAERQQEDAGVAPDLVRRRAGVTRAVWREIVDRRHLLLPFPDGLRMPKPLGLVLTESVRTPATAVGERSRGQVEVRLLGPPRVDVVDRGGAGREVSWPFRRVLHLLSLLALNPEGCTQERVIETLWPETGLAAARASLHPTVSHLRRLLAPGGGGSSAVLLKAGVYRLNPDWTWVVDVHRFEELVGAGTPGAGADDRFARLEEAWRLYRGPLLEGMAEPWTLEPRRRLDQRYRLALSELAELYAGHERLEEAEDCLRTLLAGDPLHEGVHLRLMLLQARRGRTDLVRRQYEKLCRLLARELGAQPLDATVRAVERILG
jgi:DNA-binding SARP family transcriptional activator